MSLRSVLLMSSLLIFGGTPQILQAQTPKPAPKSPSKPAAQAPKTAAAPQSLQSTHYPILLLGHGSEPILWSVLIGQKGPERFDRTNYPPLTLEPVAVNGESSGQAWAYRAKDSATGADVTIHLTREACEDSGAALPDTAPKTPSAGKTTAPSTNSPPAKNAFSVTLEHAQIGTFKGCARIAAELFPKIVNQSAEDDDDADKKKSPAATVTNFKVPTAIAFLNSAGKIVVSRGAAKKIVPSTGTDLALSHDGKKLLYTRNDAKMGSERTIVLYEFDTGRTKDLVHGAVRQPFWSPDDSRIAYLQAQDQKWRIFSFLVNVPESPTPLYAGNVDALHGWTDGHTVLATDAQNLYWIGDDRPQQTVALREVYGDTFHSSESDAIRVNPVNSDLLLVSSKYLAPPVNSPADAAGIFLYEIHAKRRVVLTTADQWAAHGEWSRDGIQVFYTRRVSPTSSTIYRVFWDGSGIRRYQDGTDLVVGQ